MSLEEMEQSDDFIQSFNIQSASTRAFLESFDENRSVGRYSSDDCLSWELQRLAAIAEKMEAQQSSWEKDCVGLQERLKTSLAKDKKLIQAEEAMLRKMAEELASLELALEKANLSRRVAAVSAARPPPPPIPAGFAGADQQKGPADLADQIISSPEAAPPAWQPQETRDDARDAPDVRSHDSDNPWLGHLE